MKKSVSLLLDDDKYNYYFKFGDDVVGQFAKSEISEDKANRMFDRLLAIFNEAIQLGVELKSFDEHSTAHNFFTTSDRVFQKSIELGLRVSSNISIEESH